MRRGWGKINNNKIVEERITTLRRANNKNCGGGG